MHNLIQQKRRAQVRKSAAKWRLKQGMVPRMTQEQRIALLSEWKRIGYFTTQKDFCLAQGVSVGFLRKVIKQDKEQ